MKPIWDKGKPVNELIQKYTVGRDREMDLMLAKYDVQGSLAHITMLQSIGLLEKDELKELSDALKDLLKDIERGEFIIEDGVEDVHSQVELMLTRQLGDMGKKIHSGRSRNDQVLIDLKLFTRDRLRGIVNAVKGLFDILIKQSEKYKNVLLPGYTHLQIAMPSSFGLWFGAYAEALTDDMLLLRAAFDQANRNPLGSAAGYGSSFPLNRQMTTDLLGFESMNYNVVYAQMTRGKMERNQPRTPFLSCHHHYFFRPSSRQDRSGGFPNRMHLPPQRCSSMNYGHSQDSHSRHARKVLSGLP